MKRDRIDRILAAIDTGLQQAADYSYEAPDLAGRCWRCRRTPTDAPDITCVVCLFDLRGQLAPEEYGPFTDEHPQHSTPQWVGWFDIPPPGQVVRILPRRPPPAGRSMFEEWLARGEG